MIIKQMGVSVVHFVKRFLCGATSQRIVLPDTDGTRVKVTYVQTVPGAEWVDVQYTVDEVVFVHRGEVEIELPDGSRRVLRTGDLYVANAGDVYTLRDHHGDSKLLCVFSAVPDGPKVDNT